MNKQEIVARTEMMIWSPVAKAFETRRHFEAERFRGLEVDGQLIFGRLLHGQVGGFGTPEDFVDVERRAPVEIIDIGAITS